MVATAPVHGRNPPAGAGPGAGASERASPAGVVFARGGVVPLGDADVSRFIHGARRVLLFGHDRSRESRNLSRRFQERATDDMVCGLLDTHRSKAAARDFAIEGAPCILAFEDGHLLSRLDHIPDPVEMERFMRLYG